MGGAESRSDLERASWVSMSFLGSVQVSMSWMTRRMMRRLSSAGVGRGSSSGTSVSSGVREGRNDVGSEGERVLLAGCVSGREMAGVEMSFWVKLSRIGIKGVVLEGVVSEREEAGEFIVWRVFTVSSFEAFPVSFFRVFFMVVFKGSVVVLFGFV